MSRLRGSYGKLGEGRECQRTAKGDAFYRRVAREGGMGDGREGGGQEG